ncbi:MAG: beta-ketoacyl-ACP synthase III [Candidatus Baltobacteraceae bacterium]
MNGRSQAPSLHGVRIAGTGHYVPELVVTNQDLERTLDTSDEWITTRTGMKERRYAPAGIACSDMALAAARVALEHAELEASEIDCFILATVTPDYPFPATACIVAARLGAVGKPAFDIEIACSGFIYGLCLGASFIRSGVFRRVAVIGSEKLSYITDQADRSTAILFGDGAGAAVLERAEVDSFLSCELGADGTNPEMLYIPAGGSRRPIDAQAIAAGDHNVHMLGREIFKSAVNRMVEASKIALERVSLTPGDVTFMLPHQANQRIIDAAARGLDIPSERVLSNVERFGNTSAASIPILLAESVERGLFHEGDLLLFVGFGGGLSWGAIAWRWSELGRRP